MPDDAEARIAAIIADASEFTGDDSDGDHAGKPRVRVDKINPDRTVAALRDVLSRHQGLFERGVPVRLVEDKAHGALARPVSPEGIVLLAHQACRPYVVKRQEKGPPIEVDAAMPRNIAVTYLDWHGERRLPPLNGITSTPILRHDGSFHSATGYDAETGIWLMGAPDVARLVPMAPSQDEAQSALRRLRRQFATFCFADAITTRVPDVPELLVDQEEPPGADESALLVALLTAICRPSLTLAPGVLIRAASMSGAGAGKGLLARCICIIAFGREPFAVTAGGNAAELDKRIAAELIAGGPTLFLDNLNDRAVKSDQLASAITERPTRVRVLGKSEMMALNASALVLMTGNGVSVSEDLARRFIAIELDARTEDPEARRFTGDIRADVRSHRAQLLAAGLTIWRWGRQQANDLHTGLPLGSFEQWASWVRDPLLALGCRDPVQRTAEAKQLDVRRQELAATFKLWQQHHEHRPVTADKLHDAVKAALDPQDRGRQFIARRLEKITGTRLGGMMFTREKTSRWSPATYALLPANESDWHRGHGGHRESNADASAAECPAPTPCPRMPPMPPDRAARDSAEHLRWFLSKTRAKKSRRKHNPSPLPANARRSRPPGSGCEPARPA